MGPTGAGAATPRAANLGEHLRSPGPRYAVQRPGRIDHCHRTSRSTRLNAMKVFHHPPGVARVAQVGDPLHSNIQELGSP